jgi:hypothetical protein
MMMIIMIMILILRRNKWYICIYVYLHMFLYTHVFKYTCTYMCLYLHYFINNVHSHLARRLINIDVCCINAFIFCVHYLCLIGRVYVFYVGHVDKSSSYETLFHCNILSDHHHHHIDINDVFVYTYDNSKYLYVRTEC